MKRLPVLMTLLALIALSASAAYWAMQLYKPAQRPIAAAPAASMPEPSIDAAASLFGGQPAAAASNFQLTGVVAAGRDSAAIIVVDNGTPLTLKVGKEVANGVRIEQVFPRFVLLSDGRRIDIAEDTHPASGGQPSQMQLQMPPQQQPVQPVQPVQQPQAAPIQLPQPSMTGAPMPNNPQPQQNNPPPPNNIQTAPPVRTTAPGLSGPPALQ